MAEEQDTRAGGFSLNKFVIAVLLFIAVGFIIETVTGYSQRNATQATLEQRAAVGDETQKLVKENLEAINQLKEKIDNLEKKLDNLGKTGNPVR